MSKFVFILFCYIIVSQSISADCSNETCMFDKAIEFAQNNRVKDPSSPVFSCMLSQWNAKLVDSETDLSSNIETYDVFGYERFLACTDLHQRSGLPEKLVLIRKKEKCQMELGLGLE